MLGKLCVCGHEMKPQGKQTLEMNGSSLGSNLWTDHVEVDMYICSWCGRWHSLSRRTCAKSAFGMPAGK